MVVGFAGIAFGMIYLPTIVGVGLYFRRKRAIATGISVAGTGFGAIIFAPFTEYLLENLGWKGAHIVFGKYDAMIHLWLVVHIVYSLHI